MRGDIEDGQVLGATARRMVYAGLMLALALPAFDLLVLSTAGKDIADEIGGEISWMFISYQVTLVAMMPLYGKLGDLYGRKRVYQTAIVLFIGASVASGLATNSHMMLIGRALQGAAGAGITGQTQAVLADVVPPRERGRVAWISPAVFTIASMAGPFIGGFFVDHLSWRWIFFVNAPLGAIAFLLIGVAFNVPVARVQHRLDLIGALLVVISVSLLAFVASTAGDTYAWTSSVIVISAVLGVLSAIVLVWHERRTPEPVFPFRLLNDRIIGVCTGNTFCIGAANFGMAVFLPLFLRVVTGMSATESGLSLLPVSVGIMLASTIVGRIVTRTGRYRWYPLVGTAVFVTGIYLLTTLGQDSTHLEVWSYTFLAGIGSGIASPIIMLAMQNAVRYEDVGVVSSLAMFSRTMGQVFGPAFGSTLMAARFQQHLQNLIDRTTYNGLDTRQLRTETRNIDALPEPLRAQVIQAFRMSVNDAFRLATFFSLAGVVIAAFMRTRPLRSSIRETEQVMAGEFG